MKNVRKAPAKSVIIIARIAWKHKNKVCYLVRASKPLVDGQYVLRPRGIVEVNGESFQSVVRDGQRYQVYQVCFLNGQIAGCQCGARVECYHKKQLIALEAARPAKTPVTAPVTVLAEITEEELEAMTQDHEETLVGYAASVKALASAAAVVTQQLTTQKAQSVTPDLSTVGSIRSNRGFSLTR